MWAKLRLAGRSRRLVQHDFKRDVDFIRATQRASDGYRILQLESERGCVLVGGAMLDEMLGALLRAFFIRDENLTKELLYAPNAPASSFSARIRLCRAIGLITDEFFRDLDRLRGIRNKAAHFDRRGDMGFQFSFSDQDIGDTCHALLSIPEPDRRALSSRVLFEVFVTMAAAVFAEHALAARFVADNTDQAFARTMMLELVPAINFQEHMGNLAREIRGKTTEGKG